MTLIRISPDGKEVVHLYDDEVIKLTSKTAEVQIVRASDIFFDNEAKHWMIRVLATGEILPATFKSRVLAMEYEKLVLENRLRDGLV